MPALLGHPGSGSGSSDSSAVASGACSVQDAISALKQQCSDFVMTRNIQSRDLIDDLQRQLSGLSFGAPAGAAAPSATAPAAGGQGASPLSHPNASHLPQGYQMPGQLQAGTPLGSGSAEQPRGALPGGQPAGGAGSGPGPAPGQPGPSPGSGVVDSFINFLGNLGAKPSPQPQAGASPMAAAGAVAAPPPGPAAAHPAHAYYQQPPQAPPPAGQGPMYYPSALPAGGPATAQAHAPQVQGYYGPPQQGQAGAAPAYGVQPGMYGHPQQPYSAPTYGGPPPQYAQQPASNPYPQYNYRPSY